MQTLLQDLRYGGDTTHPLLNLDFAILLLAYGSLPSSLFTCTLILYASGGTDGGNPRPSPTTGHS
jgi:hypothetical protein